MKRKPNNISDLGLAALSEMTEGTLDDAYDHRVPFDHRVSHSDAYYEQYIAAFVPNTERRLFYRFIKRCFDIVVSLILIILLSPVMLAVAIAVRCDSEGKVIFRQRRVGRNGKTFICIKFRTMRTDAPRNCPSALLEHPERYYTRVGGFLRRSSLDELPQLWCVLTGKMTVIGYRPLIPAEEKCNDMRKRLGVFSMRPGISGYAQVLGRDEVDCKNKAILDAEYVKRASLLFDLKLIFRTVSVVLRREGNDAERLTRERVKE